jgi:hypothetical protein
MAHLDFAIAEFHGADLVAGALLSTLARKARRRG